MGMDREVAVGIVKAVVAGAVEVAAVRAAFALADSGSVAPVAWIPQILAAPEHWRLGLDVGRSVGS